MHDYAAEIRKYLDSAESNHIILYVYYQELSASCIYYIKWTRWHQKKKKKKYIDLDMTKSVITWFVGDPTVCVMYRGIGLFFDCFCIKKKILAKKD